MNRLPGMPECWKRPGVGIRRHSFTFYDEYIDLIRSHRDSILNVKVLRGSDTLSIPIALGSGKVIGVYPKVINDFEYAVKEYSFFGAIPAGINMGFDWIKSYLNNSNYLKTRKLSGPWEDLFLSGTYSPACGIGGLSGN